MSCLLQGAAAPHISSSDAQTSKLSIFNLSYSTKEADIFPFFMKQTEPGSPDHAGPQTIIIGMSIFLERYLW